MPRSLRGRLGGEEFALILPETDSSGAALIAEWLRKTVDESTAVHADDDTVVKFTVSIGIASLTPGDASFDAMLQRADKALYQAKEDGRNRSVIAGNQPYLE